MVPRKYETYRLVAHQRIQQRRCRCLRRKTMRLDSGELPHVVPWYNEELLRHGKYLKSRLHRRRPDLHCHPSATGGSCRRQSPLATRSEMENLEHQSLRGASPPIATPSNTCVSSLAVVTTSRLYHNTYVRGKTKARESGCAPEWIGEGSKSRLGGE